MAVNTISHNDVKTNRHEYIGGSDIAKVMGLSRWGTPLSLWAEKTGKIPAKDLSDNEVVNKLYELVFYREECDII